MPERTGALYQSNNGVRATGTDANEREQSARTIMEELRELLLSGNVGDYVNALIDLYMNLKMK